MLITFNELAYFRISRRSRNFFVRANYPTLVDLSSFAKLQDVIKSLKPLNEQIAQPISVFRTQSVWMSAGIVEHLSQLRILNDECVDLVVLP